MQNLHNKLHCIAAWGDYLDKINERGRELDNLPTCLPGIKVHDILLFVEYGNPDKWIGREVICKLDTGEITLVTRETKGFEKDKKLERAILVEDLLHNSIIEGKHVMPIDDIGEARRALTRLRILWEV